MADHCVLMRGKQFRYGRTSKELKGELEAPFLSSLAFVLEGHVDLLNISVHQSNLGLALLP